MGRNLRTSAIIDGILRHVAFGGVLATSILAPNALQIFDKPLQRYFANLDERAREREYRRILTNMRRRGLLAYRTEDYEHGLIITPAGRKRATTVNLETLTIPQPDRWDRNWRIVFFDIPEVHKSARDALSHKLKQLGFVQLQRSVWVHPFPCRAQIEAVALAYHVQRYITYVETSYIDSHDKLTDRFRAQLHP